MEDPTTPTGHEPLRQAIVDALHARRWQEALTGLESWCRVRPEDASAWLNRGVCLMRLGQPTEAVPCLERCLELEPSQPRAAELLDRARQAATAPGPAPPSGTPDEEVATVATAGLSSPAGRASAWSEPVVPADGVDGEWSPGRVVAGRYEIRDQAEGGMGTVSFAWDRELERMVAVKTPSAASLSTESGRARILREAEAWIALGIHPHLCSAYYIQQIGGLPRLFIEYVDGGALHARIGAGVDPGFALDVAIQVASALDYTHRFEWIDRDGTARRGMVHRDVKPANVLLTSDGAAKLTDFGLVRATGDREDLPDDGVEDTTSNSAVVSGSWQTVTSVGGAIGTPPYMASELWRPSRRATAASDVYAFGCTLFELLAGRRPFVPPPDVMSAPRREQLKWWMRAHMIDPVPELRAVCPDVDREVAALVAWCLARDPADRPQDMGRVRAVLVSAWERHAGRPYPRPEPVAVRLRADSRANRGASFAALGALRAAERELREALGIDPRHPHAVVNLALLEWRHRGIRDAEVRRRLDELGDDPRHEGVRHHLRGRVLVLLDDPESALAELREAERSTPGDRVHRDLAVATAHVAVRSSDPGLSERAGAMLAEVLERRPADPVAAAARVAVLERLGRTGSAAAEWSRVRRRVPGLAENADEALVRIDPGLQPPAQVLIGDPVACVVPRPDGRLVCRTTRGLAVVDPVTREVTRRIALPDAPRKGRTLASLPDGGVVVASSEGPLTVWDTDDGHQRSSWRAHAGRTVAVASGLGLVVSGSTDHRLRIWDPETGTVVAEVGGHEAWITSVAVSESGDRIASASADGTVRIWEPDGRSVGVLRGHTGAVHAVGLDPAGERVVSGGADGTVRVWSVDGDEQVALFDGHSSSVEDLEVVDAGQGAVSAGQSTVRVWDLERLTLARQIRPRTRVSGVAAIADGRTVALAVGREVSILHLDLSESPRLPWALAAPESAVVLSDRSAAVEGHLDAARRALDDGRPSDAVLPLRRARAVEGFEFDREVLDLWSRVVLELPTAGLRAVSELRPLRVEGQTFVAAAFAPDGTRIVATDTSGAVWRWLRTGGRGLEKIGEHGAPAVALAAEPELGRAVSGDRRGGLRVWDVASGRETAAVTVGDAGITAVGLDASGRVTGVGDDGRVWTWEVDRRVVEEVGQHGAALAAVDVALDGRRVVAGGWDDIASIWDLDRRVEMNRLRGHEGAVTAVAWMPDGRQVVTGGADGALRLWDAVSGACRRTLTAHRGEVVSVAVGPGGRWIVSGGRDGAVTVWDPWSGRVVHEVERAGRPVSAVGVSSECDRLLAVIGDGSIRRWYLDHEPGQPGPERWDDRATPLIEARLRWWQAPDGRVELPESALETLESLVMRHGFGRPDRRALQRHVDRFVEDQGGRQRVDERSAVGRNADLRRRDQRARVAELAAPVTRRLGLKIAGGVAAAVAVLLLLASLRTPPAQNARPNRVLWPLVEARYTDRAVRLRQAVGVVSYQDPTAPQRPVDAGDCPSSRLASDLRTVLFADSVADGPPEAPSPSEPFRDEYRRAVQCVAHTADDRTVRDVLARLRSGLGPHRRHDLVMILIGGAARSPDRLDEALGSGVEDVRHAAAFALAHLEVPDGRALLVAALDATRPTRIEAASFVLPELIVSGAVPAGDAFATVRSLAASIDPRVRANAVRALILFERQGPPRTLLDRALEDSDPDVVRAAEETIDSLRNAKLRELFGG